MIASNEPVPLTVIIPTYNRSAILLLCLEHLEAQHRKDFEVIVVNDGSTDDTEAVLARFGERSTLRMRVLTQENGGQARGRNLAIAEARTELCVLIGDDILASPKFTESHLRLHQARPEREVVGLGWTRWDATHQRLTPFMEWLEDKQFDYPRLLAGIEPTWRHFYTSNLSCKTELLREARFDERFKKYGYEDIELGYRLAMHDQLQLVFLKDAEATHVHPTTFSDATRRMRAVGYAERQFHEYWPAARGKSPRWLKAKLLDFIGVHPALLQMLTGSINRIWRERRPSRFSDWVLQSHHRRGYMEYKEK